jgi:hypothetical protein
MHGKSAGLYKAFKHNHASPINPVHLQQTLTELKVPHNLVPEVMSIAGSSKAKTLYTSGF